MRLRKRAIVCGPQLLHVSAEHDEVHARAAGVCPRSPCRGALSSGWGHRADVVVGDARRRRPGERALERELLLMTTRGYGVEPALPTGVNDRLHVAPAVRSEEAEAQPPIRGCTQSTFPVAIRPSPAITSPMRVVPTTSPPSAAMSGVR